MMTVKTVAVIGAGTIGRGVAQQIAERRFGVVLIDTESDQLDRALVEIEKDLRLQALYRGPAEREDIGDVLGRIRVGTDPWLVESSDFVIENVTEDCGIKELVYREIDRACRPEVIFAANTSAISVTKLGSFTQRPAEVLGMHFMNPVPLMRTVEVVRGFHTTEHTLHRALELLRALGKEGVVVNDSPGFVTNRVLMLTINEAIFCVQDQVASPVEVDRIFKGCFGHKMGPLETGDLIGLDTILNSLTVLYESYRDSKYRPAPLLERMVDAGRLGRKTGRGFYTY